MRKLYIRGSWVESSGESFDVVSPVTGERLDRVPEATEDEVGRAVAAAKDAQPELEKMTPYERADALARATSSPVELPRVPRWSDIRISI